MPDLRRMRRFVANDGTEFDETLDGRLRRRLLRSDKSPIPKPQTGDAVVAEYGELREMTTVELAIEKGWARR